MSLNDIHSYLHLMVEEIKFVHIMSFVIGELRKVVAVINL